MAKSPQAARGEEHEFDFSKYSFDELAEIKKNLDSEMHARQTQEVEALRAKVTETAQALGMSVEDMLGLSQRSTRERRYARGKQPARYRGPNGEEWSGRGPAPRWMKPLLGEGRTKEDFLIKSEEDAKH